MRGRAALVFVMLVSLQVHGVAAQQLLVRPEPGIALANGGALVPFRLVDSTGAAFPVRAGELVAELDVGGVLPSDLVTFAGSEAAPLAIDLLVDTRALKGADLAAWAEGIATFLRPDGSREVRAVYGAGSRVVEWVAPGASGPSASALRDRLAVEDEVPLWESTLHVLDRLSGPGPPDRRVLLLVADGEEGRESRHPVQTCGDAADTARVAVWILVPGSVPSAAARARLEGLAQRTGGAFVEARGRGAGALAETLQRIRAVQALRIASLPASPPFAISLKPGVASATPARAWIRTRRPLGFVQQPIPWLPIGVVLVVGFLAAGLVTVRTLPMGRVRGLVGVTGTVRVTRSGLTIGGAKGNGLVVADSRVSRNHAVIRVEQGRPMLVDLRSANGTKVNGRRVTTVALEGGDRILLADAVELLWEEGFRFGKRR